VGLAFNESSDPSQMVKYMFSKKRRARRDDVQVQVHIQTNIENVILTLLVVLVD
jgi:hypothetical protein